MPLPLKLKPEQLRPHSRTNEIPPEGSSRIQPLTGGIIGQERAVRAMELGLRMKTHGYNIYVSGATGTGRTTYTRSAVSEAARSGQPGRDWCYVHNFLSPLNPRAFSLPMGVGRKLKEDLAELVDDLKEALPRAFENQDFQEASNSITREFRGRSQEMIETMAREAEEHGFALVKGEKGFNLVPVKDGQPLDEEAYESLSEEEFAGLKRASELLEEKMAALRRQIGQLEKEFKEKMRQLGRKVAREAAIPLINRVLMEYEEIREVSTFLQEILDDLSASYRLFLTADKEEAARERLEEITDRYDVNLFVLQEGEGSPVIYESNPTYQNLFGSIELKPDSPPDYRSIKPGAVQKANGGYLILPAAELLSNPGAWEGLKRALKNRACAMDLVEILRGTGQVSYPLRPSPIPLDVKVILIGGDGLYQALLANDPDFRKLFKVKVQFDTVMPRRTGDLQEYLSLIRTIIGRENLLPFDGTALGRIVDYSTRLAGRQDLLSTRFNEVSEVLFESSAWAEMEGARRVTASHVDKALEEKNARSNLVEEKYKELVLQDTIMIDTEGSAVGQVNGLAILRVGDHEFGKVSRITARTFSGDKGIVDIQRETEMGGQIHSKGLLILGGYLGGTYGGDMPLCLSATICFEQVYEPVDGDSASSTELYAILSSLSGLPIRQEIAVTGSVNQFGEIQAVGGINEKIEGFFSLCRDRGLTGRQGVLIPVANLRHLTLSDDVVKAVEEGSFHIWAARSVDEGITLLTGVEAGEKREDGTFTPGSVHDRCHKKLAKFYEGLAGLSKSDGGLQSPA